MRDDDLRDRDDRAGASRARRLEGEIQGLLADLERRYDAGPVELAYAITRAQMGRIARLSGEIAYADFARRQAEIFTEQVELLDEALRRDRRRQMN